MTTGILGIRAVPVSGSVPGAAWSGPHRRCCLAMSRDLYTASRSTCRAEVISSVSHIDRCNRKPKRHDHVRAAVGPRPRTSAGSVRVAGSDRKSWPDQTGNAVDSDTQERSGCGGTARSVPNREAVWQGSGALILRRRAVWFNERHALRHELLDRRVMRVRMRYRRPS